MKNAMDALNPLESEISLQLCYQNDFRSLSQQLLENSISFFQIDADGDLSTPENVIQSKKLILSGSFNPFHYGHLLLMRTAMETTLGQPTNEKPYAVFELSIFNVDKPALSIEEVCKRIASFAGAYSVVVTRAPTFLLKAKLFPAATFVIGFDTAIRIIDKKYFDNDEKKMLRSLEEFQKLGCKFLVGGRMINGIFQPAIQVLSMIPKQFHSIFRPLNDFRWDGSSTDMRLAMIPFHRE